MIHGLTYSVQDLKQLIQFLLHKFAAVTVASVDTAFNGVVSPLNFFIQALLELCRGKITYSKRVSLQI